MPNGTVLTLKNVQDILHLHEKGHSAAQIVEKMKGKVKTSKTSVSRVTRGNYTTQALDLERSAAKAFKNLRESEKFSQKKKIGARPVAKVMKVGFKRIQRLVSRGCELPGRNKVVKKKPLETRTVAERGYKSSPGTRQGWGFSQ